MFGPHTSTVAPGALTGSPDRLAAENATPDEVKQFGQRMVADHGKAGDELKGLASQKNVTLPTGLDAKYKAWQDKLSKMKGPAFDRASMAQMVTAHQQAVALFQKEAGAGKDPEAKAWAAKTLPALQAQAVLVPFALAILLTFVLAPPITRLERWIEL